MRWLRLPAPDRLYNRTLDLISFFGSSCSSAMIRANVSSLAAKRSASSCSICAAVGFTVELSWRKIASTSYLLYLRAFIKLQAEKNLKTVQLIILLVAKLSRRVHAMVVTQVVEGLNARLGPYLAKPDERIYRHLGVVRLRPRGSIVSVNRSVSQVDGDERSKTTSVRIGTEKRFHSDIGLVIAFGLRDHAADRLYQLPSVPSV